MRFAVVKSNTSFFNLTSTFICANSLGLILNSLLFGCSDNDDLIKILSGLSLYNNLFLSHNKINASLIILLSELLLYTSNE